jgi:hypothetical protein
MRKIENFAGKRAAVFDTDAVPPYNGKKSSLAGSRSGGTALPRAVHTAGRMEWFWDAA